MMSFCTRMRVLMGQRKTLAQEHILMGQRKTLAAHSSCGTCTFSGGEGVLRGDNRPCSRVFRGMGCCPYSKVALRCFEHGWGGGGGGGGVLQWQVIKQKQVGGGGGGGDNSIQGS